MPNMIGKIFEAIVQKILPEDFRDDYLIYESKPTSDKEFYPKDTAKIKSKLRLDKTDPQYTFKMQEILMYCQSLCEDEEKRRDVIEHKATILAGFSGTSIAGILGSLIFFLQISKVYSVYLFVIIGVLFTLSIFALIRCTTLALRTLTRKGYEKPDPRDIFKISDKNISIAEIQGERGAQYFRSYAVNQEVNNRKVDLFSAAQKYLELSILLIVILVPCLICPLSLNGQQTIPSSISLPITTTLTATSTSTPSLTATPIYMTPTAVITLTENPTP